MCECATLINGWERHKQPRVWKLHYMKFHIQWSICCFILPADEQRAEGTVTNSTAFAEGLDNHGEGAPRKNSNGIDTLLWSAWKLGMKPELTELLSSEIHRSWQLVKTPGILSWPITGLMTSWSSFGSRTQTLSIYHSDIVKWHLLPQLPSFFQFHTGFLPRAQKCMLLLSAWRQTGQLQYCWKLLFIHFIQ